MSVTDVLVRHVERTECGRIIRTPHGRRLPCGYPERYAIHDLYPDIAKRDPLSAPLTEADRHEYLPVGAGLCDADEDDWPCAAYQLATAEATS